MIPRDTAEVLFGVLRKPNAWNEYDPLSGFRSPANLDQLVPLPEHPDGSIRVRKDSLGLRREGEPSDSRPDLRILVLGDSHTEGACSRAETFAQLLEERLAQEQPRSVEVLNAGKSGYSFYGYAGALERLARLEPHVVLCVVYAGNDFVDALLLHHYFERTTPAVSWTELSCVPELPPEMQPSVLTQSHQQLFTLARVPEEQQSAVEAGVVTLEWMAKSCRQRSVRFMSVLLPAMADVQPRWIEPDLGLVASALALDAPALGITERVTDAWMERTRERGVEVLDLRPVFRSSTVPLYWPRDHHLNPAGHRVVAEAIHDAMRTQIR